MTTPLDQLTSFKMRHNLASLGNIFGVSIDSLLDYAVQLRHDLHAATLWKESYKGAEAQVRSERDEALAKLAAERAGGMYEAWVNCVRRRLVNIRERDSARRVARQLLRLARAHEALWRAETIEAEIAASAKLTEAESALAPELRRLVEE